MKNVVSVIASVACALLLALPAAAASKPATAKTRPAAEKTQWAPETLSGKITMVDPNQKLIVVQSDGVPFDMMITPRTRIEANGNRIGWNSLKNDQNQSVTLRFVPEARGDVARTVKIGS